MGVTLIFPGQGSQYVGMGKWLIEDDHCRKIFERSNQALGHDITKLCLEGPEDELTKTANTQPAIVTYSYALFTKLKPILEQKNIVIDRVLGHSVGEYSALAAAETLTLEDAVRAVHYRGQYMQEATPEGVGAMYAILRVPGNIVAEACSSVSGLNSKVMPANFNEPAQTVISGHRAACEKVVQWLAENFQGKHMAIPLKVSAPFHCSLMEPAEKKLASFLEQIAFASNKYPYIPNITAKETPAKTAPDTIRANLIEQVCGSVLWYQSLETLASETKFIEVGPGKVLTGLNKKINPAFKTLTLDSEQAFEQLEEFL